MRSQRPLPGSADWTASAARSRRHPVRLKASPPPGTASNTFPARLGRGWANASGSVAGPAAIMLQRQPMTPSGLVTEPQSAVMSRRFHLWCRSRSVLRSASLDRSPPPPEDQVLHDQRAASDRAWHPSSTRFLIGWPSGGCQSGTARPSFGYCNQASERQVELEAVRGVGGRPPWRGSEGDGGEAGAGPEKRALELNGQVCAGLSSSVFQGSGRDGDSLTLIQPLERPAHSEGCAQDLALADRSLPCRPAPEHFPERSLVVCDPARAPDQVIPVAFR